LQVARPSAVEEFRQSIEFDVESPYDLLKAAQNT